MQHRSAGRLLVALTTAFTAATGACSGSSSESPWPVEPSSVDLGPDGEQPKEGFDARAVPNRYGVDQDDYGESGGGRPSRKKSEEPSLEDSGAVP